MVVQVAESVGGWVLLLCSLIMSSFAPALEIMTFKFQDPLRKLEWFILKFTTIQNSQLNTKDEMLHATTLRVPR